MLLPKTNLEVRPKTTEERLRAILARPRNPHARVRLAMPKIQPKLVKTDKY